MFLAVCRECDRDSQCKVCSGDSCTGDNTCVDNSTTLCYFEECCGCDTIVTAGCGQCDGQSDMQVTCSDDCRHCSVCCNVCTEGGLGPLLTQACGK